jgi:uncharacterized membrane protein
MVLWADRILMVVGLLAIVACIVRYAKGAKAGTGAKATMGLMVAATWVAFLTYLVIGIVARVGGGENPTVLEFLQRTGGVAGVTFFGVIAAGKGADVEDAG